MPLLRELRPAGGVVVLRAAELEQPAGVSESKQHVLWYLLSFAKYHVSLYSVLLEEFKQVYI